MNTNEESKVEMKRPCHHGGRRHLWKIPFFIAAILLVKSAVVFFLWNNLVPDLFQGPHLTYIQALGLLILAKALFGCGFKRFGRGPHPGHWRKQWWASLSDEEREKFKAKFKR